jgi:hypothetical protein
MIFWSPNKIISKITDNKKYCSSVILFKVEFNICQVKRSKELLAVDVQVVSKNQNQGKNGLGRSNSLPLCQGFIAALKDGFGFIETIAHDREVFFHFR